MLRVSTWMFTKINFYDAKVAPTHTSTEEGPIIEVPVESCARPVVIRNISILASDQQKSNLSSGEY